MAPHPGLRRQLRCIARLDARSPPGRAYGGSDWQRVADHVRSPLPDQPALSGDEMRALALVAVAVALAGCPQSSTERAELELDIGKAEIASATIKVDDGLAAVRDLSDGRLELWCNAPVIDFD